MKQKILFAILKKWPKSYITSNEIKIQLNISYYSTHSLLKRYTRDRYLIRLKKDFYLISDKVKETKPNVFELASVLYGPSYISLESALSYHGLIPEAVITTTSATSKRSKNIETEVGYFSYYHVPIKIFHIGVSGILDNNSNIFIADPIKAIADIIYVKKKSWPNIIALSNDLRIDVENLQFTDLELLQKLANTYPNIRTKKVLNILLKDLDQ
ncbi:MAG: hypothetical protein K940chlam5_00060 [Candidatus Anoxychlamydiales bacterium]|nr:hypothetical protein [Candidatus Anoxychlamydiales bacterium]